MLLINLIGSVRDPHLLLIIAHSIGVDGYKSVTIGAFPTAAGLIWTAISLANRLGSGQIRRSRPEKRYNSVYVKM